jgi:hypothetical protein
MKMLEDFLKVNRGKRKNLCALCTKLSAAFGEEQRNLCRKTLATEGK